MKTGNFFFSWFFLSFFLLYCNNTSFATAVKVQSISVKQVENSLHVNIGYDLVSTHQDGHMIVSLVVKNGGNVIATPSLTGDIGRVLLGRERSIIWDAGKDWPENATDKITVEITAKSPQGGDPTAEAWYIVNDQWVKNFYSGDAVTMSDLHSGLMWVHNTGQSDTMNRAGAVEYAENLDYAGHTDWFLPNNAQIQPLYSHRSLFAGVRNSYWSSSMLNTSGYFLNMPDGLLKTAAVTTRHHAWPCRHADSTSDYENVAVSRTTTVHTWEIVNTNNINVFYDYTNSGSDDAFQDANGNGIPDAFEDFNRNGLPDAIQRGSFDAKGRVVPFNKDTKTYGLMNIIVKYIKNSQPVEPGIDGNRVFSGNDFRLDWSGFLNDNDEYAGVIYRVTQSIDAPLNIHNFDEYIARNRGYTDISLSGNASYYIHVAPIRKTDASMDQQKLTKVRIMREDRAPFLRSPTHTGSGMKYSVSYVNFEFLPFYLDGESVQGFIYDLKKNGTSILQQLNDRGETTDFNKAFFLTGNGVYEFTVRSKDSVGVLSRPATHTFEIVSRGNEDAPNAEFRASPTRGSPPMRVRFTDLGKGQVAQRDWDFTGNNIIDRTNPPSPTEWTYTHPGTYTVSLTATGPGGVDTHTVDIVVGNSPPVVQVAEQQIFLSNLGDMATLDASLSFDPNGGVLSYSWREHHDNPHLGLIPLHYDAMSTMNLYFPSPGRYRFDVRVSDGTDRSVETRTITVYVPGRVGLVGYTPSDALVRVPDALVRVHDTSTDAQSNRNPVDIAISDSLGRYFLENISPVDARTTRTYYARVDRPGFISSEILTMHVHPDPVTEERHDHFSLGRGYVATVTGHVRERVQGAEGVQFVPIENVLVSIIPGLGGQVFGSTTDSTGRFEISNVPRGTWIMQLHAEGYQPEVRDVNVATGMPEIEYTMRRSGGLERLGGTVYLSDTNNGVPGAKVSLGTGAETHTDENGVYRFTDLPIGDYTVTVTKHGYEPIRLPVVSVQNPGTSQDIFLSFATRGPSVTGEVTDQNNKPVGGAGIEIRRVGGAPSVLREGRTDPTGYFQIHDVPLGSYRLVAIVGVDRGELDINVANAINRHDISLPNYAVPPRTFDPSLPVAKASATIIFLNNLNQGAELDGRPSEGSDLRYLWRENPANPILGLLPADTERMSSIQVSGFRKPGIYLYEMQVRNGIGVSANTEVISVFVPGLSGNIHASPSDGVFGLNAATIRAYTNFADASTWRTSDTIVDSTQSLDNPIGNFALRGLSPGTYWVVARAQEGTGFRQYGPVPRQANYSHAARETRINMPRDEFQLTGTVRDKTGNPLENVRIVVAPGSLSESYRTTTDATGRYQLSAVPRGSGQPVMVMHADCLTSVRLLDINANLTHNMELDCPGSGGSAVHATLQGTITAPFRIGGTTEILPAPYAEVIIGSGLMRTYTNSQGRYEFTNLPPGNYYGTIRKPGYLPKGLGDFGYVQLNPGTNEINKVLSFDGHGPVVSGTVLNISGQPVAGATLSVRQPAGGFSEWASSARAMELREEYAENFAAEGALAGKNIARPPRSDAAGIFQMIGVPHGQREIEATLPDGKVYRKQINVVGNMRIVLGLADFHCCWTLEYAAEQGGRIEGSPRQSVENPGTGTTVTAVANTGYHFTAWSDGLLTPSRQDTQVDADLSVTARFAVNSYQVRVGVSGSGGTVDGARSYVHNTRVTLTASPNEGYRFLFWKENGRIVSREQRYTFLASGERSLTAHFQKIGTVLPGVLLLLLDDAESGPTP